jgi:hypothetical protein
MSGKNSSRNPQPDRLSIRWALILLCGLVAALVGGGLALLGRHGLPESVAAAFVSAGATISWMHRTVA